MKSLSAYLIQGLSGAFLARFGWIISAFLVNILLARTLGARNLGYYAYCMSVFTIIGIIGGVGYPILSVREIARFKSNEDLPSLKGFLFHAASVITIFGVILIAVFSILVAVTAPLLPADGIGAFLFGLPLILLIPWRGFLAGVLKGFKRVIQSEALEGLMRHIIFGGIVLAAFLFYGRLLTAQEVIFYQVIGSLLAVCIGCIWVARSFPAGLIGSSTLRHTSSWITSGIPLALMGGLTILNQQADILVLGIFRPAQNVGVYRAAAQTSQLIVFFLLVVDTVMAPLLSEYFNDGKLTELQRLITVSYRIAFILTIPVMILFALGGDILLGTLFGEHFSSGHIVLLILSLGQMINLGMGPVALLLNMTRYEKDAFNSLLVAAGSNLVMNFLLIPKWGMSGGAVSTAISLSIWNILMAYKVETKLNISPHIVGRYIFRN